MQRGCFTDLGETVPGDRSLPGCPLGCKLLQTSEPDSELRPSASGPWPTPGPDKHPCRDPAVAQPAALCHHID